MDNAQDQAQAASAEPVTEVAASEPRRKIAGLVAGRVVNFKLTGGCDRPFIVVDPKDATGEVVGVLFFDPEKDREFLPENAAATVHGTAIVTASYDEAGEGKAGMWDWPKREPVVASGVDAPAFDTLAESLRADLTQLMNVKIGSAVEAVKQMLDEQSAANRQLLIDAGVVNTGNGENTAAPTSGAVGSGG